MLGRDAPYGGCLFTWGRQFQQLFTVFKVFFALGSADWQSGENSSHEHPWGPTENYAR